MNLWLQKIWGNKVMGEEQSKQSTFGLVSVALGFLSLAAVVGHFFAGPFDPSPPMQVSIAEKAASIRDATVAALKGEEYEAPNSTPPRTLDDYLTYTFIGVALLAVLMAVIGFVKHESWRPALAGAGLGGLAIAFQVAITLFFALLFAMILAAVIDTLDFSF